MRVADAQHRHAIRVARAASPQILDFVRENPFGLPEELIADARAFRHAVRGRFIVERVLERHVSRVRAQDIRIRVDATLSPWRGR